MSRAATVALGLLTAGCMPVGVEVAPAGPIGPTLVIDVTNASDQELTIGYEFEYPQGGGTGEGLVTPCERTVNQWGEVAGAYSILFDGESLAEAEVPPGAPADGFLVVTVRIDPDGEATMIAAPRWTRDVDLDPRPIPACG